MIPTRYLGPIHTFGLMWREEGLRGFYRGYLAYLLATSLYVSLVPLFGEFSIKRMAIGGNYDDESDSSIVSFLARQSKQ
jgi:hypothetical protein